MDDNQQNGTNNNLATTNIKIWLPPSYTNNKTPTPPTFTSNNPPTPPAPKKRPMSWDFIGKTWYERLILIFTFLAAIGAIAIPVAIAIETTWFSYQQNQTNQQIAQDQQHEALLQSYLDHMSDLLLSGPLLDSKPGESLSSTLCSGFSVIWEIGQQIPPQSG